jgi:hypothetical protein
MSELGRPLIVVGAVLLLLGLFLTFGPRIPGLGRLPGDIVWRRGDTTVYFPVVNLHRPQRRAVPAVRAVPEVAQGDSLLDRVRCRSAEQSVGGVAVRGDRRHHVQREVEQRPHVDQERPRVADPPARVLRLREVRVHDPREEAVGPVRVRADRRVELRAVAQDADAVLQHGHAVAHDALAGDVRDVLGVVQERDLVVVAAEQQDAPPSQAKRSSAEPAP